MQSSETLAFRVVLCHELVILLSLDRLAANPHRDIPCQVKFTGRRGCWRCPHTCLGFLSTQAVFGILLKMIDVETGWFSRLNISKPVNPARCWFRPEGLMLVSSIRSSGVLAASKVKLTPLTCEKRGRLSLSKKTTRCQRIEILVNDDAKESNV